MKMHLSVNIYTPLEKKWSPDANIAFHFQKGWFVIQEKDEISLVNFINILRAAFTRADPKSTKKTDDLTVFFALSGSAHVKAGRWTLMKLTPGRALGNNKS